MSIFGRVLGKVFGTRKQQQAADEADYQQQQTQRAAEVAKARAVQQRRIAEQAAKTARELTSPQARAQAAQRAASSRASQEARERQAKQEADRQLRMAQDMERRAVQAKAAAEQALRDNEKLKAKAREALLRTRANATDPEFYGAFKGPRPARKTYKNVKPGTGELPAKDVFLLRGIKYSAFASSNVEALQFDPTTGDLYVCYLTNRWYRYTGVGAAVAESMYVAASHGVAVWDELRVRGTIKGNRYPTTKAIPPAYLPLDTSAGLFAAGGGGI